MVVLLEAPATQQNRTDGGSRCATKQRKWTYGDVYGDGFGWPNKGGCLQWWFWMLKQRKWTYEDVWCGDFGCQNKGNGCLGMFAVVVLGAETKEMDLWGCLKWWLWVPKQRKWTYGDVFLAFWSTQPCTHPFAEGLRDGRKLDFVHVIHRGRTWFTWNSAHMI